MQFRLYPFAEACTVKEGMSDPTLLPNDRITLIGSDSPVDGLRPNSNAKVCQHV